MKRRWMILPGIILAFSQCGQSQAGPEQPSFGPGGKDYFHEEVVFRDFAEDANGYWLFEPAKPRPFLAPVVVLIHGFGAYNPMEYGAWIRHLVRRGNVVIFPRYQKRLMDPQPFEFAWNTAEAIHDALRRLDEEGMIQPDLRGFTLVGHSYGGVVAADLAANYAHYGIPPPKAILLAAPGSGPLRGGRLRHYGGIPSEARLLILVEDEDQVVGKHFPKIVYQTAVRTAHRNLLIHFADEYGDHPVTAGHNEVKGIDEAFNSDGVNASAKRALKNTKINAMDYYGYWKLLDGLQDCILSGSHCDYALGNTDDQKDLGQWSDGTPVRTLRVFVPATHPKIRRWMLRK